MSWLDKTEIFEFSVKFIQGTKLLLAEPETIGTSLSSLTIPSSLKCLPRCFLKFIIFFIFFFCFLFWSCSYPTLWLINMAKIARWSFLPFWRAEQQFWPIEEQNDSTSRILISLSFQKIPHPSLWFSPTYIKTSDKYSAIFCKEIDVWGLPSLQY